MADAVTSQTLSDGPKYAVMKFTNVSDGTGEDAVTKVDVSALDTSANGDTCTGVVIERIWWQCIGMKLQILLMLRLTSFALSLVKIRAEITTTPFLVVLQITQDLEKRVMSTLPR